MSALMLALLSLAAGGIDGGESCPAEMTCAAGGDSSMLLLTTGTDAGLAVWVPGADPVTVSTEPGAGRNAFVQDGAVFFKECTESCQRICEWREGEVEVLVSSPLLCGPFPGGDGILFSDREGIRMIRNGVFETLAGPDATGMPPSAALRGEDLWYVDGAGGLVHVRPGGAASRVLTEGVAGVTVSQGVLVVRSVDGRFLLLDGEEWPENPMWTAGTWPAPDGLGGCCYGALAGGRPSILRAPGQEVLVDGGLRPFEWPGHGLVCTDAATGMLEGAGLPPGGLSLPGAPGAAGRPGGRAPEAEIDVPWMHQRWDTPDWFDGSWSCGPSSCTMAQQYYNRLTPDSTWCSSPSPGHWSTMGWYIPDEFTFLGCTYDILGVSPGEVWVPGAHGFICRDAGGAYWSYMALYLEQMGLESAWAGTAWSTVTSDLDNLWPVVCSSTIYYSGGTYGHIILFAGYYADHTVIVNDPYGDANETGWGQSWRYPNGKACLYDWPGYNNGHLEIGAVNQLFNARHEVLVPADTLVDDLCLGFEKLGDCAYWHEEEGGWNGTFWWTWSTALPPDTCFAKWKPQLPCAGWYEVSVFIPEDHAGATGIYRLSTPGGTEVVELDQGEYGSEWAPLGTWWLVPGDSLYLGDFTGTGAQQLAFDAALFSPQPASAPGGGTSPGPCFTVQCPSHGSISISSAVPLPGPASVEIFDLSGRLVERGSIPVGEASAILGAGLPPGCYSLRLSLGGATTVARTVLLD